MLIILQIVLKIQMERNQNMQRRLHYTLPKKNLCTSQKIDNAIYTDGLKNWIRKSVSQLYFKA